MTILTIVLGLSVLSAAACRLLHLNIRNHKAGWVGVYLFFAIGALVAVGEATQGRATAAALLLLAGAALYLWGSRITWRNGAPLFMEKT